MKFIISLFAYMLCFNSILSAQRPVFKSKKYYGGPTEIALGINDIKPTRDKGYIFVGTDSTIFFPGEFKSVFCSNCTRSYIQKIDSSGSVIWKKTLPVQGITTFTGLNSVVETDDGGYITTGSYKSDNASTQGQQLLVAKFSVDGILLWERKYGGTDDDWGYEIVEVSTGGFIVVGTSASNNGDVNGNQGLQDLWLLRINETGNIIWSKLIGDANPNYGFAITQAPDHGYIVGGNEGWFLKTDSSGNLIWQQNIGLPAGVEYFQDIQIGSDNSIVLSGHATFTSTPPPGYKGESDIWAVKTNSTGTILWSKYFGGTNNDYCYSSQILSDNSIILVGTTTSTDGDINTPSIQFSPWILRLTATGDIIWKNAVQQNQLIWTYTGFYNDRTDEYILSGTDFGSFQRGIIYRLGNTNTIKGITYLDANSNSLFDNNEQSFNRCLILVTNNNILVSGAVPFNGQFEMPVDTGSYTTTVQLFNPYYNVVPSSRNTNFTTYFNVDSFGFAIQPIPNKQDLQINFTPLSPARPGFKAQYVLNYKNVGTTTIASGSVKLIKDSRTTLTAALPVPSSVVADTLTWNYTNLKPLDSIAIGVEFQLAAPPALNINDTLKYTAVILPVAGDLTPADDTSRLRQRVVGSYDPNDKQESFAGKIPLKSVQDGSYINYVIRFQNTGNDTAFFVRLLDTLDAKLDWNSFQMIGSSHSYNLTIKDGNKLNWFFDNIKLPDSTTNRARSIGYVAFRIKPKNTLVANEIISNKASIYFDYNLPIVTNTTNTVVSVETTTAVREVQNDEMKMRLGPNPSNGYSVLQISGKLKGKFELRMIDANGRIISQQTITRNSTGEIIQLPLNLQQLSSGVYLIQLQQKEKSWWQKIVLQ